MNEKMIGRFQKFMTKYKIKANELQVHCVLAGSKMSVQTIWGILKSKVKSTSLSTKDDILDGLLNWDSEWHDLRHEAEIKAIFE